jgi:hypothetical protein
MTNLAVFPSATAPTTVNIEGRVYTLAVGSAPIVVPDFDAAILQANGWLVAAKDGAGTTAQRPAANPATGTPAPRIGYEYWDTTLGAALATAAGGGKITGMKVIWNGSSWISELSGVVAALVTF